MIAAETPDLSVSRQCALLGVSRSSVYYRPVAVSQESLDLMGLIDRQFLKTPYYGSRRMAAWLNRQGYAVGRGRVRRLMRLIGLEAIYQKPKTSKPAPEHKVYPYLLGGLVIDRVSQVWCTDITYVPMARGFLYLVVIMDWVSRYALAWRLSNSLEADFCVDALEEALIRFAPPEVFNSDQGSQFTSLAFTERLSDAGVEISMDGKGRFMDNIFIERLWRSLKYEEVYLKAYDSVAEARAGIGGWLAFYNTERLHQALDYRTPAEVFGADGPWICGRSATRSGCASPMFPADTDQTAMLSQGNMGKCSPSPTSPQPQPQPKERNSLQEKMLLSSPPGHTSNVSGAVPRSTGA